MFTFSSAQTFALIISTAFFFPKGSIQNHDCHNPQLLDAQRNLQYMRFYNEVIVTATGLPQMTIPFYRRFINTLAGLLK